MDLGVSGLASGFDWRSFIDQMLQIERTPQNRMRNEQSSLRKINDAYASLKTQLQALKGKVEALQKEELYQARTAKSSDASLATASAATGAAVGEYRFTVSQWATAAMQQGLTNRGAALSPTNDVSGLVLSQAAFSRPVTAGTFTVNGRQISLETTDTLQGIFDKIAAATGGAVTGSYDAATDTISLTSASPIVLGAATDTSNFLQVARLSNNGTGTVTSRSALGSVQLGAKLNAANFSTPITGDAAGKGEFKINGVSIAFDTATDTVAAVLARINQSSAGVYATYDAESDRFVLTNKTTGDVGIALEDVTGNFLAATGLSGGTLQRGADLQYSVNGSSTLISRSNTITEETSGIAGLSVTLLKPPPAGGTVDFTVTVGADTEKVKTALNDFLSEYNKTQSLIDSQTAITTDANGKVTANTLAGMTDVYEIARQLRALATQALSGLSGGFSRLSDLGVDTSGTDNSLKLANSAKLDDALNNRLSQVAAFFTDKTYGFAAKYNAYLEHVVDEEGVLAKTQNSLNKQVTQLDDQIAEQERYVQNLREQMVRSFMAMENAQARANQQLSFLLQRFKS
ncbi:MAG: flagellar filament capping protein FliD [Verrucomicrobiae bacterium]|nr:flagellar filament capping protein FliD [Verrucomicrobiae bacterium]